MRRFYLGCVLLVISGALAGCAFDSSVQPGGPGVGGADGAGSGGAGASSASSSATGSSTSGSSSSGTVCACDDGLRQVAALPEGWSFVDLAVDATAACPEGAAEPQALSSLAEGGCSCSCGDAAPAALCAGSVKVTLNVKNSTGCAGIDYSVTAGSCLKINNGLASGTRAAIAEYPTPSKVGCSVLSNTEPEPAFVGRSCLFDATPLGCDPGAACVAGEAPLCVKHPGVVAACPAGYPDRKVLYEPGKDERGCGACECESDATTCGGATVQVYSTKTDCDTGTSGTLVPSGATCESFTLAKDGSHFGTTGPLPDTTTCSPKAAPELTGAPPSDADAWTICCAG